MAFGLGNISPLKMLDVAKRIGSEGLKRRGGGLAERSVELFEWN